MSKAFTKESDDAPDDDDDVRLAPLLGGGKNYITGAGYARLRGELMGLIDVERPKMVDVVHWAASNGDRSENGDYIYGKKRLREIDRRIRFLTGRLEIAVLTDPSLHHHILKSQLLSVGIFFAYSPSETALSLASVHLPHPPFWVAFPVIFSLCSLFLIRVLASVRDHVCI